MNGTGGTSETGGISGSASRTGDYGMNGTGGTSETGGISGTSGSASRTGDYGTGGTGGRLGKTRKAERTGTSVVKKTLLKSYS